MKDLLRAFEAKSPEIVFHWSDPETDAQAWCVINSLRGGAAGGGTRMHPNVTQREVLSLAKTMEIKFQVAGPDIGGGKSGIRFDPADPRKEDVLRRWYKALRPMLKSCYGTGGDMNVDELHEVIPMTAELGIDHPQEGVFQGHFQPSKEQKERSIGHLQRGVVLPLKSPELSPLPNGTYTVADMITGFGVGESIRHFCALFGEQAKGKRAIIQGWGNVASAAAWYLSEMGIHIVGIIDRAGGIISEDGLGKDQVRQLFLSKKGNQIDSPDLLPFDRVNELIWDVPADIFIPAAASRLITQEQLERMHASGVHIISSGANVPFADEEIFYGPIAEQADKQMSCIPDFISNCGMARVFAYLMQAETKVEEEAIFSDVSQIIYNALSKIRNEGNDPKRITERAYAQVLNELV